MRFAFAIVALVACNPGPNGTTTPLDAPTSSSGSGSGSSCTPPSGPMCSTSTCNHNNVAETCWYQLMPGHCYWVPGGKEPCDGTDVPSCKSLGYLGGTATCTDCKIDATMCSMCGSSAVGCERLAAFTLAGDVAVSGSYVAFGGVASVAITNGLTSVTETQVADVRALVGVPGGWLVATDAPPTLSTLDVAGARGALHALPGGATAPVLAYGPGGRVLVAWKELVGTTWYVLVTLTDTSGNVVVPAFSLFVTDGSGVAVTSDGTSFFVGSYGQLARVASDGTFTVAAGFPQLATVVDVSWRATTGWYVSGLRAQRFSASGALAGSVMDLQPGFPRDFVGDGDDLLEIERNALQPGDPYTVFALRYGAGGQTTVELAGISPVDTVARAAYLGDQLLVAWNSSPDMQLALLP